MARAHRMPKIAIALAVVAVVMVGLAIYVRGTRDDGPVTVQPSASPPAPHDAWVEPERAPTSVVPDPPPLPLGCVKGCRVASDCPTLQCECASGVEVSARSCINFCCQQLDCATECKEHGGAAAP